MPTPGNVAAKLEKARGLPVDILMLDLEDGVPGEDAAKARARTLLGEALASGPFAARELAIRINGPRTAWFREDVEFVAGLDIPTVVVPMVEDADDMVSVEGALAHSGAPESLGLILLIETPAGVLNLPEIVKACPRANGLIAGGLDYAMCMHSLSILPLGGPPAGGRHDEDLLYMRQRVLAVARAHGLSAIDAMRPGLISDLEAFRTDAAQARWLGFDGVDFYHPAFIDIANEVFTPSAEELAWAERVLGANQEGEGDAPASRMVDGRVVLPQHIEIARRLTALAEEIAGN
jgi:citrate lyase subunit beta/citryl-CoA lyase